MRKSGVLIGGLLVIGLVVVGWTTRAKAKTLTGKLVDLACYVSNKELTGNFHQGRGLICAQALDLKMPAVAGEMAVDDFRVKRYPVEGNAQAMLHQVMPPLRKFYSNVNEIESVHIEIPDLGEIASPECWDPSNRETADHSLPYLVAVALTDGEVYLNAFTPERYLHDAGLRQLLQRITCEANEELKGTQGRCRWTVRKKNGEVFTHVVENEIPINYQDVLAKFDRVCAYMKVPNDQRDRAKATWSNFKAVKDTAQAMALLAHFGPPLPLNERAPYASDVLGMPRKS